MNEAARTDQTARTAPEQPSLPAQVVRFRALLAFALFGAALAWALQLMVSQLVSEWSYFAGEYRHEFLDVSIVVWVIAGATLVLLGIGAGSLLVAGKLRRGKRDLPASTPPSTATVRFAAAVGLLSGVVFLLLILTQALPLLFFPDGT